MRTKIIFVLPILFLVTIQLVSAHCPLCTAAAGAGVGILRVYGIDDSIVGLFLGALIVSTALWFNKSLEKKIKIPFQRFLIIFASFLLTIAPLYLAGIIRNMDAVRAVPSLSMLGFYVFGIDKLLFGSIIGTLATFASFSLSDYIKNKKGKVLWPYQGLSFMMISLFILSEIFWIINK